MAFDTEQVLKNCFLKVKEKLNAEIAAINTEKGDFEIAPINDAAYYFAQIPKAFNYNPFVVYGFDNPPAIDAAQADNHIKPITMYFEIVLVDGGSKEDQNIIYKLLRYSRALENVFNKNHSKIMEGFGNIQITGLVPTTLFSMEGKTVRSAGVSVTARITSR